MKKKQAPKGRWRYGCVKRTYVTKLPKETFKESCYELVEVFDQGKSWTAEAVSVSAESYQGLIRTLEVIISDLKNYAMIEEPKSIIRDMRKKNAKK